MKRSKLVEERFEECLELVFKGENVEDCVRRYPEHETELRELLDTAIAARTALQVQPSPEFRERARQQLYAAQRERVAKSPARVGFSWNWQPRWATALAAVVLAVVAGTSTVLASTGSMPGQPLYGVKHAAESARVALTPYKSAKAEIYASLADQRVQEIVYLADTGNTSRVQQVTDDLNSYLNQIAVLAGGASQQATVSSKYGGTMGAASVPSATNPPQFGEGAPATGTTNDTSVPGIAAQTPPPPITVAIPPRALAQAPTVTVIVPGPADAEAKGISPALPPVVVTNISASKGILKARITFQAAENAARLKAALDKAPPQARPALLRAIAVSQSGYEKALQSLDSQP